MRNNLNRSVFASRFQQEWRFQTAVISNYGFRLRPEDIWHELRALCSTQILVTASQLPGGVLLDEHGGVSAACAKWHGARLFSFLLNVLFLKMANQDASNPPSSTILFAIGHCKNRIRRVKNDLLATCCKLRIVNVVKITRGSSTVYIHLSCCVLWSVGIVKLTIRAITFHV